MTTPNQPQQPPIYSTHPQRVGGGYRPPDEQNPYGVGSKPLYELDQGNSLNMTLVGGPNAHWIPTSKIPGQYGNEDNAARTDQRLRDAAIAQESNVKPYGYEWPWRATKWILDKTGVKLGIHEQTPVPRKGITRKIGAAAVGLALLPALPVTATFSSMTLAGRMAGNARRNVRNSINNNPTRRPLLGPTKPTRSVAWRRNRNAGITDPQ